MTTKEAIANGTISHHVTGGISHYYLDVAGGGKAYPTALAALAAHNDYELAALARSRITKNAEYNAAAVKCLRDGDSVVVTLPGGSVLNYSIREYRQTEELWERIYGPVCLIDLADLLAF